MSARFAPTKHRAFWCGIVLLPFAFMGGEPPSSERGPGRDMAKAYRANNRGILLMEQYQYSEAVKAFDEVVRLAPDWLPGRINLGIALLNASSDDPAGIKRTEKVFREVLGREPDNPHAHFGLGILLMYRRNALDEAAHHFESVLQKNPTDAHSWYWLGSVKERGSDEQIRCYREALRHDRHLKGAIYGVAMNLLRKNADSAQALLEEMQALDRIDWVNPSGVRSGAMGPYAEMIGRVAHPSGKAATGPLPRLQPAAWTVRLAEDVRWAKSEDFGRFTIDDIRRRIRRRFGASMAALDYNGDGKLDLFLAGAVIEKGRLRNLLLRNDGGVRFTDVTAETHLAEPRTTLGCCVADFDNDGLPDLLLTGIGGQKLFRNAGRGQFQDVTAKAGLDKLTSVCLGAGFVDLDHDGVRDLLICEYAATPRQAQEALKGEKSPGQLFVFRNAGEPLLRAGDNRPSLTCAFRRLVDVPGLKDETASLTNLTVSDLDGDGDLDLLLCADHAVPTVLLNDRLLRFRRPSRPLSIVPAGAWNGALVLDADGDGNSDLLLIGARQTPRLLLGRKWPHEEDGAPSFAIRWIGAPPLRQAVAADLDLDSWTDVIGLSEDGWLVFLHNKGGRLQDETDALGGDWPRDLVGVMVGDVNGDGRPDVITWSETKGLLVREGRDNGNRALVLELVCRTPYGHNIPLRCSADGFGTRVRVHGGGLTAEQEWTTLTAGLGQSLQPLFLGLGPATQADVVRLRWLDGVRQAEGEVRLGRRTRIEWKQRRPVW